MALDFPWQLFAQAQQQKNQNQQDMYQNISGIGQGLGNIGDVIGKAVQQQKQKKLMADLVKAMQGQGQPMAPVQGPQGYAPPGAGPSVVPAGQRPPGQQDNSQQIQSLMMQMNPDLYMKDIYPKTLPKKTMGGVGKRVVYQNPDGSVSLTPIEGATPLEVSDAQAMQYTATPKSAKEKNKALESRTEAWQRSIDVHQIDQLVKATGLTSKQQASLQMNNQRAARANEILSKPNITWQELALGEIDLTGIMQGGVPQRDEVAATHFPGWQQNWAKWKTYASGHPTENVPLDIKNKVQNLINGVIKIDNTFLTANAKFAKGMLGQTIRGGLNPSQNKNIDEITKVLTSAGQGQPSSQTVTNDPLGIMQ
jgi:hypothetical protein